MSKEFKKYPERPNTSKIKVCECGHMIYNHKGWMIDNSKKECEKCMCPQYIFKVEMLTSEFAKKDSEDRLSKIDDEIAHECPKCKISDYVRWAWCGKYHCTKCEWVFGKTPNTQTDVVEDQYAWWNKSE